MYMLQPLSSISSFYQDLPHGSSIVTWETLMITPYKEVSGAIATIRRIRAEKEGLRHESKVACSMVKIFTTDFV